MNKRPIKNIIWDVDGTLYQNIPALKPYYNQFKIDYLAKYLPQLSVKDRELRFQKTKAELKSNTKTIAQMTGKSITEVGQEFELYIPKKKYIRQDPHLVELFASLIGKKQIKNFALRNGMTKVTKDIIDWVGLKESDFVEIVGMFDRFADSKPDDSGYRYLLEKYHLVLETTLAIGDRINVDLVPAKKLGMQTALVWQKSVPEESKDVVDFVLPTVYDLASIL
ncbi:hypothetical protein A2313_00720 [Candidatus Roizmanbacteria bacterium RIFOXYB2_FULL_41_10]|uniref:Haloacid dehalogenase n=1 Tax=Candidatus Roizmanbacteria bacterium RIFOXYA1_FULL_41_12 TaxID=1802082 RepID=A0A1F7K957_9BACT|nr:MAG: hypothetical protein A2209_03705 [Candidatus Roizmanbacteria bacterium RIFOXYA1_FULL_41_12]OGK66976.1 MAG: hypothetical protein A2377_03845 [Candidatus Roizmanbacteria bacterium RIFOXYB1_FULL_41_27]OGK67398.1 MAG: hypothetical protein A2262_03070 [Candidatus Roizmanbacteria bacterium RIFOXYA2_FULL_41_8]OGK68849.1 MAG: hypothetical protein A2313_00720 [Candidatus Roizmanbacteria bacterium RIFOXYB2_FULL_41_10]OGK71995.1 MAG: hypothetical protein A2403_03510 [Candidatus Roizmanbacteria bac